MLQVTNLCYERDERCLFKNLSFSLDKNCALQITGANGSGKTTLLRILTGLLMPTSGEIYWQQQDIAKNRAIFYAELLYLGHLPGITSRLTPKENLRYYLQVLAQPVMEHELTRALTEIGLADVSDIPSYLLSAGQQRRIALARLLLTRASLWILDEPLTSLDQQGISCVEQLIIEHLDNQGMIVVTSHQPLAWRNYLPQEIML